MQGSIGPVTILEFGCQFIDAKMKCAKIMVKQGQQVLLFERF
jgi:hypothetical protein